MTEPTITQDANSGATVRDGRVWFRSGQGYFSAPSVEEGLAHDPNAQFATPEEVQTRVAQQAQNNALGATKAFAKEAVTHAMDAATAVVRVPLQAAASVVGDDKTVQQLQNLDGQKVLENLNYIGAELRGREGGVAAREYQEATRAQVEANPTAAFTGGIVGDVAGSAGLNAGAEGLGAAASRALAPRVGSFGAHVAGQAINFGTQGALFGAGAASEQAYFENTPLTRQKLWAGIGMGAALGAGLGAGVGTMQGGLARIVGTGAAEADNSALSRAIRKAGKPDPEAVEAAGNRILESQGVQAAPGVMEKARDAVEAAQSAMTGIDKNALKKYGVLRWDDEAMRGRELAFNRDEILEGAKREFSANTDALIKSSRNVFDEVSDMSLKREHIASRLSDNAGAQIDAARAEVATLRQEMGELAAGADAYGNRQLIKNMDTLLRRVEHTPADSAADAYIALDSIKRSTQRYAARLNEYAGSYAADPLKRSQAGALFGKLQSMSERTRGLLEDSSIWGEAAEAQQANNQAWQTFMDYSRMFNSSLTAQVGEDFGKRIYGADPGKVSRYLDRFGLAESKLVDEHVTGYLDAVKSLTATIGKSFDLGAKAADVQAVATAADAMRGTLDKAQKTLAAANQVRLILDGGRDSLGSLGATAAGGMIGGPIGSAVGLVAGALTNPGRQLRVAWGIQQLLGKADTMRSRALRSFFASATEGTEKSLLARAITAAPEATRRAVVATTGRAGQFFGAATGTAAAYEKRREQLAQLTSNPALLQKQIEGTLGSLPAIAPQLGTALAFDVARKLNLLQQMAPGSQPAAIGLTAPAALRKPPPPDAATMQRFADQWDGVMNPYSVLADLQHGRLSYDKVEAARAAHPELMQEIALDVFTELATRKKPMLPQAALQLDLLLGTNGAIEPSVEPGFLSRMQSLAKIQAQDAQSGAPQRRPPANIAAGRKTLSQSIGG